MRIEKTFGTPKGLVFGPPMVSGLGMPGENSEELKINIEYLTINNEKLFIK